MMTPLIMGQTSPSFSKEQIKEAEMLTKKAIAGKETGGGAEKSVMIIDPKVRAKDFIEAYNTLKKERIAGAIEFVLTNGNTLKGITDIQLLEGGTLMIFQLNTTKGQKYQVVKIEDIKTIAH